MIGHPIEVKTTSQFDWAEIGFKLADSIDVASLNDMTICWYDEVNNVIVPQATHIDYANKTIYATVSHFSKYFLTYKKSTNKKQINIVCVIDTIYSTQDYVNKSIEIIKSMVNTLVSKQEYNINIYFLDTNNANNNNFATKEVVYKGWNDTYAGSLIAKNIVITDVNKAVAEGIVTKSMYTGNDYLLNNNNVPKPLKNGRYHNFVIGFLDGFWYYEDTVNHTNTSKKSLVKFPNFDTNLLVCENGLYFRGQTVNSSNLSQMQQVLPELLVSIFEVNKRVIIPETIKLMQNNTELGRYSNIVLANDSLTMDDEVERHVTGYSGKIIVGTFSATGEKFLVAGDDAVICTASFDILAKLSSQGIISFDQITVGANGISFNTFITGKDGLKYWGSVTKISDLFTGKLEPGDVYLSDLQSDLNLTKSGNTLTLDLGNGIVTTSSNVLIKNVNGMDVVNFQQFEDALIPTYLIDQVLANIDVNVFSADGFPTDEGDPTNEEMNGSMVNPPDVNTLVAITLSNTLVATTSDVAIAGSQVKVACSGSNDSVNNKILEMH